MGKIISHKELIVYQRAFEAAMEIFILTKSFSPTALSKNNTFG